MDNFSLLGKSVDLLHLGSEEKQGAPAPPLESTQNRRETHRLGTLRFDSKGGAGEKISARTRPGPRKLLFGGKTARHYRVFSQTRLSSRPAREKALRGGKKSTEL
jgi:hypothetical protein